MHFPRIADGDYLNIREKRRNDASSVHARRDHQFLPRYGDPPLSSIFERNALSAVGECPGRSGPVSTLPAWSMEKLDL